MNNMPKEKYRKILLSDEISDSTVKDIITNIMDINWDDEDRVDTYKDFERKPIQLFINSPGGSVYAGLSLVDAIKQSETPVHTIAIGHAMSMGFWIYLAGHERYVGENATLMFHEISTYISDKGEGIKLELEEMKRLQAMCNKEIVTTSAVTQKQLDDYIKRKAEWYIPAEEAVKLKLANGIYTGF